MRLARFVPRPVKDSVLRTIKRTGYQLVKRQPAPEMPADVDEGFVRVFQAMKRLSPFDPRMYTTYKAVEYLHRAGLPGDLVECGVYQGLQILVMAHTLVQLGVTNREIYLYDTFAGMTQPTPEDYTGTPDRFAVNLARWEQGRQADGTNAYKFASVDEVRANLETTGYPMERFHVVKGDVLETVHAGRHARIAFVRFDTDWYVSTKHELEQLYWSVVSGGILVIDDYGRWRGARQATDEYFSTLGPAAPMLIRTGGSERVCVKR